MGESATLDELHEKVTSLSVVVKKQSEIIAKTGQQLMDIQVKNVKQRMQDTFDENSKGGANKGGGGVSREELEDYATNEDLVQLVGELQGQLDLLEERNIKRTFNAQLTPKSTRKIAPVFNKDGDEPPADLFPTTVAQFENLEKSAIIQLCEFYELIMPLEQQEGLARLAAATGELSVDDTKKLLDGSSQTTTLAQRVEQFPDEDVSGLFDELARYLGLTMRRTADAW